MAEKFDVKLVELAKHYTQDPSCRERAYHPWRNKASLILRGGCGASGSSKLENVSRCENCTEE